MSNTDNRDGSVDRLLRASLGRGAGSDFQRTSAPGDIAAGCVDAETLAAWADGGLSPRELASVETHLAGCSRCQAILATIPPPAVEVPSPQVAWWRRGWTIGWLVPLTAGAAAIAIWTAVPNDNARVPTSSAVVERQPEPPASPNALERQAAASQNDAARLKETPRRAADAPRADAAPPAVQDGKPAAPAQSRLPQKDKRERDESLAKQSPGRPQSTADRLDTFASASPAAAVGPASPNAEREPSGAGLNEARSRRGDAPTAETRSPDAAVRWRYGAAGSLQQSTDGGATWQSAISGVTADLLAASAPSPAVCWVVGRAGTVLLTVDGRSWQRQPFNEPVDLVAVQASDARTATVTAADRRRFRSTDGGRTWTPVSPQEF